MQIVRLPSITVVGIIVRAPFDELWARVPEAWAEVFARQHEIEGRVDDVFVDVSRKVVDGIYHELLGAQVDGGGTPPDGMRLIELPERTVLRHVHTGSLAGIAQSYGEMYAWAAAEGIDLGDFKLDRGYLDDGSETDHELHIEVLDHAD